MEKPKRKQMKNPDEYIGPVAETPLMPEIAKDLPAEAAPDALSIVIDAVNSSVGGLIITDLNGKIRFSNAAFCKMFAYSHTQVMGKGSRKKKTDIRYPGLQRLGEVQVPNQVRTKRLIEIRTNGLPSIAMVQSRTQAKR